jgi:hypothetical protein
MLAWKTITLLWPFLKELFLGKKTLREALKTNKGRVFVILAVIGSVIMNVWLVPNTMRISLDYVELKHKYDDLKKSDDEKQPAPATPPTKVKTDIAAAKVTDSLPASYRSPASAPEVPTATAQQWSSYDATLNRFNQIAQRERQDRR